MPLPVHVLSATATGNGSLALTGCASGSGCATVPEAGLRLQVGGRSPAESGSGCDTGSESLRDSKDDDTASGAGPAHYY